VPTMHGGSLNPSLWQRFFLPPSVAAVAAAGRTSTVTDKKSTKKTPIDMAGWLFSLLSIIIQRISPSNENNESNEKDFIDHDSLRCKYVKIAMGIFCTLFECWSCLYWNGDHPELKAHSDHGLKGIDGKKNKKISVFHIFTKSSIKDYYSSHNADHTSFVTEDLLSITWECAQQLIAHGLMDNLWFTIESVIVPTNTFQVLQELDLWFQTYIESNYIPSDLVDFNTLENRTQCSYLVCHEGEYFARHDDDLHFGEEEEEDGYSIVLPNPVSSTTASRDEPISIRNYPTQYLTKAISIVMDSIFPCHISTANLELTALKILLTIGCRTLSCDTYDTAISDRRVVHTMCEAMLHGRRVLLAMKVCYLIYLQTDSPSNRTTAQATLRQIVATVFERLETCDKSAVKEDKTCAPFYHGPRATRNDAHSPHTLGMLPNENDDLGHSYPPLASKNYSLRQQFQSLHHKDAFLIIRSLCMLTMKPVSSTPTVNTQITQSGRIKRSSSTSLQEKNNVGSSDANPLVNESILQSKILGLELLLEIFTRTRTATLLSKIPALIFAVKHFLCYSLLSNCTSSDNTVVTLSLKIFVPLIQNCRHHLKTEIEAFVTQVFFVLLDSKNTLVENKRRVVQLFEEICRDPHTLAEIFLNYDCDLSAVDLFQRIVSCLAKVAKYGLDERDMSSGSRGEKIRQDQRMLRLEGMKAMREILASLNASIISSMRYKNAMNPTFSEEEPPLMSSEISSSQSLINVEVSSVEAAMVAEKQSFVQIYDSKKKRKEEEAKVMIRFNQKPTAGIKYASQVGLVNGDDPSDIASFLIANNDVLDKTQIGEYLGRDPDIQDGFPLKVLHQYVAKLDFTGLSFDEAIRFYLSGFRLPGEAQKVRCYFLFLLVIEIPVSCLIFDINND